MKTIEVSFVNRRKEKIAAETISLTDAPGWVVLKTDGDVVEMISASVIKRLKIVPANMHPTAALELEAPVLIAHHHAANHPQLLSLPSRRAFEQNHHHTPLLRQRA